MTLPENHALRQTLHNEVHARPPIPLRGPCRLSYLALMSGQENIEPERAHVRALCQRYGFPGPTPEDNHFQGDLGPFRLKWERHTEFTRYKFIADGANPERPFDDPAIGLVPADWIKELKGQVFVSTNIALLKFTETPDYGAISRRDFSGNTLIGSAVGEGVALALSDLRIHEDGFSRLLIFDKQMTQRQAGRMVQRLVEIETYRILALLALPVARALSPFLAASERELAEITTLMKGGPRDDPALLDRLTQLQAAIESRYADNHYRFSAADAYYALVQRRIEELREERVPGLQTFNEFMERRLAPAMSTCQTVSVGIETLSERVARSTNLLSTRVGMVRERQNQTLLEAMARRAELQLRLQQTVEGLSVAAISYYLVGLVGYAAKALKASGLPIDPDVTMGLALPFIVGLAAFGIRNIRKHLERDNGGDL
ncbi:MAG: DUF3422 domain-containing protein [Rhodomicrobium sp.]|nr:DUF3422 domain-containing protein [Rhodomicrobium sp.]